MQRSRTHVVVALVALAFAASCAAGDPQYTPGDPAGFWTGIWHGMISFITLVVGIFSDSVGVYEVNNTGGWYDFGFLLGVSCVWGGSNKTYHHTRRKSAREKEWEEIGQKVEVKLRRKIRDWAEAEPDEEWEVVGDKAEEKLKRKLREWAEAP